MVTSSSEQIQAKREIFQFPASELFHQVPTSLSLFSSKATSQRRNRKNGAPLLFRNPIGDAISRIRFAPQSDNLLISSWDSDEFVAFSTGSDGSIRRYDLHSGTCEVIGNHDDLSTCIGYSDETCQVIISGLHKKIFSWDTRMEKDRMCLVNLGSEVDSMSISGFDIMLAVGTSVCIYDLRSLSRSAQSKKSDMDIRIKCVSSVPRSKGFAVGYIDGLVALKTSFLPDSDDIRYTFRCHPKSADKRLHLVSVNDIVFNPHIGSAFFTGDNEGYVSAWNAQGRKRLFELPRYPNSVASLSINHRGQLLAVASSYTYQEANEIEDPRQIFIQDIDNCNIRSGS